MIKFHFFMVLSFLGTGLNALEMDRDSLSGAQITVYEEIARIAQQAKTSCAQCIYDLVKNTLQDVQPQDSLSLYELVMPIFVGPHMKSILKLGCAYASVSQLYEEAARIAYSSNDIEAMVILSIASEQARSSGYGRYIFALGSVTGALLYALGLYIQKNNFLISF